MWATRQMSSLGKDTDQVALMMPNQMTFQDTAEFIHISADFLSHHVVLAGFEVVLMIIGEKHDLFEVC